MVFIGLGDKDWAFQRVTKFVEERGVDLPYLKVNPFFDPFAPIRALRSLLGRINLAP